MYMRVYLYVDREEDAATVHYSNRSSVTLRCACRTQTSTSHIHTEETFARIEAGCSAADLTVYSGCIYTLRAARGRLVADDCRWAVVPGRGTAQGCYSITCRLRSGCRAGGAPLAGRQSGIPRSARRRTPERSGIALSSARNLSRRTVSARLGFVCIAYA